MQLRHVKDEQNLRDWLSGEIAAWNAAGNSRVSCEWIEPTRGSSVGISDCKITYKRVTYGVELKHWFLRREGIEYKIRPVQRMYNKMGVMEGRKLLYLASIDMKSYVELTTIRGDNAPLRNYCCIEGSGCETAGLKQSVLSEDYFSSFLKTIDDGGWWR